MDLDSVRILRANGVDLCAQTFGAPGDPPVLLVAGAGCAMEWWDAALCQRLAAQGRRVIRYDLRDTGRSTHYPVGAPGYGLDELVADAVGLLDALDVAQAQVVGTSLGGAIGQRLGIEHADRVGSLALLSTSPGLRPASPPAPDLPMMAPQLLATFTGPPVPDPDWADRTAVVDSIVAGHRQLAGAAAFDEAWVRDTAAQVVERDLDIAASRRNPGRLAPGAAYRDRLGEISAPTVVLHGTLDPLFPYGHAVALAGEIPWAQLVPLTGTGHQPPPPATWDTVLAALLSLPVGLRAAPGRTAGSVVSKVGAWTGRHGTPRTTSPGPTWPGGWWRYGTRSGGRSTPPRPARYGWSARAPARGVTCCRYWPGIRAGRTSRRAWSNSTRSTPPWHGTRRPTRASRASRW